MKRNFIFLTLISLFLSVFLLSNISATCEEGQIDVNTATLEELDSLYGIGLVKAQAIIDARLFDSVDSLIDVVGIGNATLTGIKSQGLACVENGADEDKEDESEQEKTGASNKTISNNATNDSGTVNNDSPVSLTSYNIKASTIKLNYAANADEEINNTKDIKSSENSQILKNRIATYGFFVFSAAIIILLIIRWKKGKEYKNDFE